ncbi:hypothetical protein CE91St49_08730 [Emergencia timonensis]|nr:hypothetical protein CE91St48_08750 [Emergencia timonensis]BDF11526.1 hypothetical protein CE91St49_08730 [Emergencia timonensis]
MGPGYEPGMRIQDVDPGYEPGMRIQDVDPGYELGMRIRYALCLLSSDSP